MLEIGDDGKNSGFGTVLLIDTARFTVLGLIVAYLLPSRLVFPVLLWPLIGRPIEHFSAAATRAAGGAELRGLDHLWYHEKTRLTSKITRMPQII